MLAGINALEPIVLPANVAFSKRFIAACIEIKVNLCTPRLDVTLQLCCILDDNKVKFCPKNQFIVILLK